MAIAAVHERRAGPRLGFSYEAMYRVQASDTAECPAFVNVAKARLGVGAALPTPSLQTVIPVKGYRDSCRLYRSAASANSPS